jgi:hypothetical protein
MKTNDLNTSEESQRELAAGVLKQAVHDLRRFHGARSRVERELYYDAYGWVMSDDYSWPLSFPNVCRLLNRVPEELRQELVGDLAFGPLGQWTRRCGRAVRRVLDSLRPPSGAPRPAIRVKHAEPTNLVFHESLLMTELVSNYPPK